jgi:23S rRNA (cytosine1962-C5)-methyltransferase
MSSFFITATPPTEEYALLDSGMGEKLERFGAYTLRRPDPQALWGKRLHSSVWSGADGMFIQEGRKAQWRMKSTVPASWQMRFGGLNFTIKPSAFKHVGIFPEHLPNWAWMCERITHAARPVKMLNLFGYTGGATLAALQAGAEVTHVDASKTALAWARGNAAVSGLADKKVRWLLDDASDFVQKELRRGNHYDAIVLDPPAFGHGPKGEVWNIEESLVPLLQNCFLLLSDTPLFVLLNGYASGYSAIAYENNLLPLIVARGGSVEKGEIAIQESGDAGRLLPAGIFARWHV